MGVDIAKLLAKNLTKYGKPIGFKPCTLTKSRAGIRTPGALTGGSNVVETHYNAVGRIQDYAPRDIDGTLITEQDRMISILGASIEGGAVPEVGDRVTIADPDGSSHTYAIQLVQNEGIGAMYTCTGRE